MLTFSELHGHSGVLETVPVNKSTSGIGKDYIFFFVLIFFYFSNICLHYYLYRLLAYDPNNDCSGIFMDWFLFPSCCSCRCLKNPLFNRATFE